MDVKNFADALLSALADIERFEKVVLQAEGPTVSGNAYLHDDFFLRFYFNEVTGTTAFALIENQQRIWGLDYDNPRGWHLHPVDDPSMHINTQPLSVTEILELLENVLVDHEW